MALKVNIHTGKKETGRPAGLVRRGGESEASVDNAGPAEVSINEFVESIFSQVRSSIESTADVEVEITANIEVVSKDGKPSFSLDLSGESPNARTLRLKFSTKINPKDDAKG